MYDTIIVGGGSAGSVLAHRLSAKSANKVLLCEAGQDTPPGNEPPEIRDSYSGTAYFDPRFHWTELKVTTQVVSHNNPDEGRPPLRKYEQARVLGGGSSINGQTGQSRRPDRLRRMGSARRRGLELEGRAALFQEGRARSRFRRTVPRQGWPHRGPPHPAGTLDGAFAGRCRGLQARRLSNSCPTRTASSSTAISRSPTPTRPSNASRPRWAISIATTRKRANLTISTNTQVKELLFEGTRCVGVKAMVDGREQEFRGREIVLSCGAIHSPAHLLRAGIGPVGHLKDMGIPVLMGLEGVGQRLMDHPSISLSSFVRRGARMNEHTRRHIQIGLRYSSGLSGVPKGDMFVAVLTKSAWHAVGAQIGSLLTFVNKTYSETGQVKLASRDPSAEPIVEFNLLSDRRDLDRLMSGFRKMAALQMSAPLRAVTDKPFPASYTDRVRKIGVVNAKNRVLTTIAAALMDGPAALRHYMIDNFVVEGFTFDEVMSDDEALEAFVRKAAIGVWHASCSCRMGRPDDPMAVVDTQGRVKGVQGLRVVDASIFPVVPCANTNFPTLMAAEKIAEAMQ